MSQNQITKKTDSPKEQSAAIFAEVVRNLSARDKQYLPLEYKKRDRREGKLKWPDRIYIRFIVRQKLKANYYMRKIRKLSGMNKEIDWSNEDEH